MKTVRKSRIRAAITGVCGYVLPDVLTNAELAQMVDTSDEWILDRTGIKERRILKGEGLGTSHMGAHAVRGLLAKTGTAPQDVDLLICATTTPDFVFPSSANLICDMAGIQGIGSFDVQAACSGFVYALTIAAQFIETGKHRKVVVVGADKMSAIIDYTDRATCVLFGDGAGAVVVSAAAAGGPSILDFEHEIDGGGGPALCMPAGGSAKPSSHETVDQRLHYVKQDGQTVFKFAVRKTEEVARRLLERNGQCRKDELAGQAHTGGPAEADQEQHAGLWRDRPRVDTEQRLRDREEGQREEGEVDQPAASHLGGKLADEAHRSQKTDDERAFPQRLVQGGAQIELLPEDFGDERVGEDRVQAKRTGGGAVDQDGAP